MVNNLLDALKPMRIICALSGFFYTRKCCKKLQKQDILFNIFEHLRCCTFIYIYITTIDERDEIKEIFGAKTLFSKRAEMLAEIFDHVAVSGE